MNILRALRLLCNAPKKWLRENVNSERNNRFEEGSFTFAPITRMAGISAAYFSFYELSQADFSVKDIDVPDLIAIGVGCSALYLGMSKRMPWNKTKPSSSTPKPS